jgi:hypothetical protein
MPKVDYMKVIGAMSRTLNLETIDMKFRDKSTDRLEVTLGGDAVQEKKFLLSLSDYAVELVFSKQYLAGRDFDKWVTRFEYELEQAFVRNVDMHVSGDTSNHILKITI